MIYTNFIKKAMAEDCRNCFTEGTTVSIVPTQMTAFYKKCNPADVEINYPDLGALRLYSIEQLDSLQEEYNYSSENFIFATNNGDPIFLKGDMVYISLHEIYRPELLANSFEEFLAKYVSL